MRPDDHAAGAGTGSPWAALVSNPFRRHVRDLPPDRVRNRVSAYIYGNVLVLGAVLAAGEQDVASGAVLSTVGVTTVTTYAAHLLAHAVAERLDTSGREHRSRLVEEIADAAGIVVSGLVPTVLLLLAVIDLVPPTVAQVLAVVGLSVRLAIVSWRVEAHSGRPASRRAIWGGVGLALTGVAIACLKAFWP